MTSLYLLKDIHFNKDYSGVVDFDNKDLQRLYFQSRRVYGFPTSYNYIRGEIQSVKVEIPQIEVQKYSYFEFTNSSPDGSMKTYYAFIDETRYLDPTTTQIIFTIDVWQTYLFDYEIKDCFIDREHQNRFFIDSDNNFRPIFNTENENIEVGSDYAVLYTDNIRNGNADRVGFYTTEVYWLEVIATEPIFITTSVYKDKPLTIHSQNITLPLYVYYVPFIKEPNKLLAKYRYNEETEEYDPLYWKTVGDMYEKCVDNPKVVAIRIEPYPAFNFRYEFDSIDDDITIQWTQPTGVDLDTINVIEDDDDTVVYNLKLMREDLSLIAKINLPYTYIVNKDLPRNINNETKLKQYPYEFYSITNYRGDVLKLKPEYLGEDEFKIRYKKSLSFNNKTKIYVENYLGDISGNEYSLIDNSISELPLATDAYKQYISSSKASATAGVAVNAGLGVGGLAVGSALLGAGGPVGSLAYLALGLGITGLSGVKSELMKQSDLKETPLSERQSGNDLVFDIINNNLLYKFVKKRITPHYYFRLYDYFYRYGYKANRFGVPNLRSRYYFNYIKTISIDIVGNINNNVKEALKQIFKNGTTIWHCRADNQNPELFVYEKENAEVEL